MARAEEAARAASSLVAEGRWIMFIGSADAIRTTVGRFRAHRRLVLRPYYLLGR
jgi:hypothetical protein